MNDEYTEQCYDQQPARDVHEFALSDAGDDRDADRSFVDEQLPSSLIVTNVDSAVFADDAIRENFERMFADFDPCCTFHYLPEFRRVCVDFESHVTAANAKLNVDGSSVGRENIRCFFAEFLSPEEDGVHLHAPPATRQYLLSPPASPPVEWDDRHERKPAVDLKLLAVMAQLEPGEQHQLIPSNEVTMLDKKIATPSVVVQICENHSGGSESQ